MSEPPSRPNPTAVFAPPWIATLEYDGSFVAHGELRKERFLQAVEEELRDGNRVVLSPVYEGD